MGCVKPAGDDEGSAGHGKGIGDFAEDQETKDADPQKLRVGKRCEHGSVGVTKRQHHDPLARSGGDADEDAQGDVVPARRHRDRRHQGGEKEGPTIDE